MVVLEINNIHILKNIILPLFNYNFKFIAEEDTTFDSSEKMLLSKKYLDFC